jgi:prepilin-type N-terminal cleavage/methylation domain-containing protein
VKNRNRNGFTLLELMVVIAIIVVLAGLLFPAVQSVLDRAKKVQAKNDLTQIVTAVNAFYTEYGRYPVQTTSTGTDSFFGTGTPPTGSTNYGTNDALFNELRAVSIVLNTRQIVFISPPNVKDGNNPRSGIGAGNTLGQYFDPWGKNYNVAIDTTYDNHLSNPYTANTGAGPDSLTQGVIAWCLGKDKNQGTDFSKSDDVISWQ